MVKKYLEVLSQGKTRRIDAEDFKAIFFFKMRKIPPIPAFVSENEFEDLKSSSPAATEVSFEEIRERLADRFLE